MAQSFWNPKRDAKLKDLWATQSASQIAAQLGTTRNAVIGRIHRIEGTYAAKIAEQAAASRAVTREKVAQEVAKQRAIVVRLVKNISSGMPRDQALEIAQAAGGTLRSLADVAGISRERVRQVVERTRAS